MSFIGNLDEQIERLKRCEYLKEVEVKGICDRAREILSEESNVQRVDAPVTVRVSHFSALVLGSSASLWLDCNLLLLISSS
jgi:hypothetical protein